MSQLTSAPPDLRAATPAELTLRVCGTPQNGRLVRLRGANCTVGSDSQCTLRLRAAGVASLHCLILRGAERTLVRSLAGLTRINGRDVSEANLELGDRLMIGPIEFEVVDGVAKSWAAGESIDEKCAAKLAAQAPPLNVDSLIGERKEIARQGRARARRLLVQLRELRRESDMTRLRLARLEESGDRLNRELADAESERQRLRDEQARQESSAQSHDADRGQIEEQRKAVEQERAALEQERGALEQARATMQEERRSFDQQRTNFEQQRAAIEQERGALEQARVAIQQERDTVAREKSGFDRQRSSLGQAKQQIEQEWFTLSQAKQQIELDRATFAQEREAVTQEREAVAQERAAIEQQRSALAQERSTVESQHLLVQQELRAFEKHKHALTAERLDWQSETSRAEAELAGRRQELDQRAAAIEKQHSEQEAARRRLEESQRALAKRQETLQQAESDLLERKRQVQEQERALVEASKALEQDGARLDADRQKLAQEQVALAGQRPEIVEICQDEKVSQEEWSRRLAEQARQLTEATERLKVATKELANQQSMFEAVRQEQDGERQQWEAERARLRFEYEQQLTSLRPRADQPDGSKLKPADGPAPPHDSASAAELGIDAGASERLEESATTNSSYSVAHRPGQNDTDHSDKAAAELINENFEMATADEDVVARQDAQPQEVLSFLADEPPSEPIADSTSDTPRTTEDESIDDYMTRLLKRVQNIGQRHRPSTANAATAPSAAPTAPSQQSGDSQAAAEPEGTAVQEVLARLSRRAAAPELSSDIAAMRELANLSARAAIDKYAYRNWGRAAFGKLTIAILAAAAGVGAVHFAAAPDSMLMYAGLLSFVIALFWLLQAGILIKNVFQASRRQARMAQAICERTPENGTQATQHRPEAEQALPAEIIAVRDSEGLTATPAGSL